MELTQSVLFSITRVKLTMYEQRILTKIVEYAQLSLRGEAPRLVKKKVSNKQPSCHVQMRAAAILDEGDTHYNHVYEAARSLMSRRFEFWDYDKKTWHGSPLIYNVTLAARSGLLDFYVDSTLIDVILDFRMGWKGYDLETALTLPTPAAVRLYVLMSRQTAPLTYRIDDLKKMFGVEDKYSQTADFIKKVIDPAAAALKAAKVTSFSYARIAEGGKTATKGKKTLALTFFPLPPSEEKADVPLFVDKAHADIYVQSKQYLSLYEGFTSKDLVIASKTLKKFCNVVPNALSLLSDIGRRSRVTLKSGERLNNPKGWIVSALQKEIDAASRR